MTRKNGNNQFNDFFSTSSRIFLNVLSYIMETKFKGGEVKTERKKIFYLQNLKLGNNKFLVEMTVAYLHLAGAHF